MTRVTNNRLHSQIYHLLFRLGLAANINATATVNSAQAGEPHYTSDGKRLYVFDGTANRRAHGLDMACTYNGEIVCSGGEVTWSGEYT